MSVTTIMSVREGVAAAAAFLALAGCGRREVQPVEIYPEDMCALCRMAVSDQRFAAEIIEEDGTAHKFDDLGCLEQFRARDTTLAVAAVFVKDYTTGAWLPEAAGTIVTTGVNTPMGSGRVAFANADQARAFAAEHPGAEEANDPCCGPSSE